MKLFHCSHCEQRVFFENDACEACGSRLGFVTDELAMAAFFVDASGLWTRLGGGEPQRPCANYADKAVCNWMLPAADPSALCLSCRTTDAIPELTNDEGRRHWASLEQAKRRLFYTLLSVGLPAPAKHVDPAHGVAFRFLESTDPDRRVMTGHDGGVITLNAAEADDAQREKVRTAMHEPFRSLVGHFRHESGHYYWDRLVSGTAWIEPCRELFGDEREDYAQALEAHYQSPAPNWQSQYISAYASSHPWEDWAESWAHYLHMIDGLETAASWGLRLEHATIGGDPVQAASVDAGADSIEPALIQQWLPIAQFSNAMNRSLGLHDSYPFVVPTPVLRKLDFIHRVVRAATHGEMPMNFTAHARHRSTATLEQAS